MIKNLELLVFQNIINQHKESFKDSKEFYMNTIAFYLEESQEWGEDDAYIYARSNIYDKINNLSIEEMNTIKEAYKKYNLRININ